MLKHIFCAIISVGICVMVYSQDFKSININLVSQNDGMIPEQAYSLLEKRLNAAIVSNGYGTESGSRFVLVPSIDIVEKDITSSGMMLQKMIMTLVVGDIMTGQTFASSEIKIAGIGDTELSSFNKAFSSVRLNDARIASLLKPVGLSIKEYLERNSGEILNKAEALSSEGNYDEALSILASIPSCVSFYSESNDLALKINAQRQETRRAELNNVGIKQINAARAKWNVRQDYECAEEALAILAEVDPSLDCFNDAMAFIEQINQKLRDDEIKLEHQKAAQAKANWEFKMKQYNDQVEMKKQAQADRTAVLSALVNRFGRFDINVQKEKTYRFGFAK